MTTLTERTFFLDPSTLTVTPSFDGVRRLVEVGGAREVAERELLELVRQAQGALHDYAFTPTDDRWGLPGCTCGWRLDEDHSPAAAEEAWGEHREEVAV